MAGTTMHRGKEQSAMNPIPALAPHSRSVLARIWNSQKHLGPVAGLQRVLVPLTMLAMWISVWSTVASCTLQKQSFTLIDASTNQDIWQIEDGGRIAIEGRLLSHLNIRVNTSGDAASVVIDLDDDVRKIERLAPYAVFGDNQGDSHRLTATAYPNKDGTGEACDTLSVDFNIDIADGVVEPPSDYKPQVCDIVDGVNFNNGTVSTIWLKGDIKWLTRPGAQYVESEDGTARISGTVYLDDDEMDYDFQLSGRTFSPPDGSPKVETYYVIDDTSGWYYYPDWQGTVGNNSYNRHGPSFQVGVGANMRQSEVFGASGWFADVDDSSQHAGDINIRLANCRDLDSDEPTVQPTATPTRGPTQTPTQTPTPDNDGDGRLDGDDTPLAEVVVKLIDSAGNTVATTTTNRQGRYLFGDLPLGTYTVMIDELTLPSGKQGNPAYDPDGGDDNMSTVTINEENPNKLGQDFAYFVPPEPLGSIGDRIWSDDDNDGNGRIDGDDEPLANVRVMLLDEDGNQLAETTTNQNGIYLFSDYSGWG